MKTGKKRLMGVLAGLALVAAAAVAQEDFSEARLRQGREAFRQRRYAEAIDLFRIAAFGFLDRPARLAETLARQSVAEHEAGRAAQARSTLERFLEVERKTSVATGIRLEPEVREVFRALLLQLPRERLLSATSLAGLFGPSSVPASATPQPLAPSPTPLASPAAQPVVTATSTPGSRPAPPPAPTATATSLPAPPRTPTATATEPPPPTFTRTATPSATATRTSTATATSSPAPTATATQPPPTATRTPSRTRTPPPVFSPSPSPTAAAKLRPRAEPPQETGPVPAVPPGDLDEPPRLKSSVSPLYPAAALRDRVRGLVILRVLISEAGKPAQIHVLEPARDDLTEAAVQAIRTWRFEPARKGGAAVRTWVTIRIPFEAIAFAPGPARWAGLTPAATASPIPTQRPTPLPP